MADVDRIAHLRGLEAHLRAHIRGQDHVLPRLAGAFARAALGLTSSERPGASLLLVGPTGTGKSETFACATQYVFGPDRFVTFDMSEYQGSTAIDKFLGEGRDDPGLLGRVLLQSSTGGLLFDEIEKAHPLILDLFLQILWRGCVTVATGQVLCVRSHVIGFTSNIGAGEAMRMTHSTFSSIAHATLRRVDQTLRPELVGRFDEKFVFARLSPDVQREICALEVKREIARLGGVGYDVTVSPAAMDFLMREGFHPHLGARPLRKTIERHLQGAVLRDLFSTGVGSGQAALDSCGHKLALFRS